MQAISIQLAGIRVGVYDQGQAKKLCPYSFWFFFVGSICLLRGHVKRSISLFAVTGICSIIGFNQELIPDAFQN
jgi:hypothetical protein